MRAPVIVRRVVECFNVGVGALVASERFGPLVSHNITMVSYVGRRSGRTFRTPVGYRRSGDEVVIGVRLPDAKNWWCNFLGEGGPISMVLDGAERSGHAVTTRDDRGGVSVRVRLDPR